MVFVASLDKAGASDAVPHKKLLEALRGEGVGESIYRYLWAWITKRRLKVRFASPQGNQYSRYYEITRGLPQGGVLSPFSWIVFFDQLEAGLEKKRAEWGGRAS